MNVKDKTIFLTGACGGIGSAIARALAFRGAKLILIGRDERQLEKLSQSLPGRHQIIAADLLQRVGVDMCVKRLCRIEKPVDVLINNAGISEFSLIEGTDTEKLRNMIECNLTMPIVLTKALLENSKQQDVVVLNVGSTFGAIGYPGFSAYCATKFGLRGFSEALSRELGNCRARVLYLAPRATNTSANSFAVNQLNKALGNRTDTPEYVANHVCEVIRTETSHTTLGWPEKIFVKINSSFSSLVTRAIRGNLTTIQHYAQESKS